MTFFGQKMYNRTEMETEKIFWCGGGKGKKHFLSLSSSPRHFSSLFRRPRVNFNQKMTMENQPKRGLMAMLLVTLAVIAVVCVMTFSSSNSPMHVGRSLSESAATPAENKMAFKAMKLNTKYELKSEQKTILRGGSVTDLANAAKAMKSNIYAGIKDMKKVVLEGLPGRNRASTPVVQSKVEETKAEDQRREMPAVSVVKGAYKAMKGQIKTSMRTMKGLIMGTSDAGK